MASVLEQLGETDQPISNNLVNALRGGSHPDETLEWLREVVGEALRASLGEVRS
jgi:hypothetical protein